MVFLHGTIIMHRSGLGKTAEERSGQVEENEASVHQYENYVPVGKAVEKLNQWAGQGAELAYLSSHQNEDDVRKDREVLSQYHFPGGPVFFRQGEECYADVVEKAMPDILIEDDCKSIGGEAQMAYPCISREKKKFIKSIVVREFSGIDHLPDDLDELMIINA